MNLPAQMVAEDEITCQGSEEDADGEWDDCCRNLFRLVVLLLYN